MPALPFPPADPSPRMIVPDYGTTAAGPGPHPLEPGAWAVVLGTRTPRKIADVWRSDDGVYSRVRLAGSPEWRSPLGFALVAASDGEARRLIAAKLAAGAAP